MRVLIFLTLLINAVSVFAQDSSLVSKITYDDHIEYAIQYETLDSLKIPLDGFFNTLGESWESEHWNSSDYKIYSKPFLYLLEKPAMMDPVKLQPLVMSITPGISNQYLAKVAYIRRDSITSIEGIYFVLISKNDTGGYKLSNPTKYLTRKWTNYNTGSIKYVVNPQCDYNDIEAKKMDSLNLSLSKYFKTTVIPVTYYSCKSHYDLWYAQGEDRYYIVGYIADAKGGRTIPQDKTIYAAIGSQYYPHELVHVYLYQFQKKPEENSFSVLSVEGIPTFLGGSEGVSLEYHLNRLATFANKNKIATIDDLRVMEDGVLGDTLYTKVDYALGGLIAMLIEKKLGLNGIIELCNAHNDNEVFSLLAKTYKIKSGHVDEYILKELKKYE